MLLNTRATLTSALLLFFIAFTFMACEDEINFGPDFSTVPPHFFAPCSPSVPAWPTDSDRFDRLCGLSHDQVEMVALAAGVSVYKVIPGDSTIFITERDRVLARYTIWNSDLEIFNSTWQNGFLGPISLDFELSQAGQVTAIPGLKIGVSGMSRGEIRTIVIPPDAGLTTGSFANDTLIVDFELFEIID